MSPEDAATIADGEFVVVRFGSQGSQYAWIKCRVAGVKDCFIGYKWQRNRRRWTQSLRISASEIMSRPGPHTRAAFYVDKEPPQ